MIEIKQAFDGVLQQVDLELNKKYIDHERYPFDLLEYLQPEFVKNLEKSDGAIYLFRFADVTYDNQFESLGHIEDDESDDVEPFTLQLGKLNIRKRDQLAEKLEKAGRKIRVVNERPNRGMTNLVIDSIGNACYNMVKNAQPEHWWTKSDSNKHNSDIHDTN